MQVGFDATRIAGTLRYGLLDETKRLSLVAAIATALLVCVIAAAITVVSVNMASGVIQANDGIGGIVALVVALVVFCFTLIRYVVKNVNCKKQISLWLEDAVELKAYARKTGEIDKYDIDEKTKFTIRVSFKYNGNHCKFASIADSCWRDYCDKEVDILYSPKYREVILLKPKKD